MARVYIVVTESITKHGIPLGDNTYIVAVKTIVDLEARVPIPIGDEIVYTQNVVNIMVP